MNLDSQTLIAGIAIFGVAGLLAAVIVVLALAYELRVQHGRRSLAGTLAKFARFSPRFMADGRGDQEQADRDSL